MTKRLLLFLISALCLAISVQAQAPRTMNAAEIQLALKKLGTVCSLMHIAAHPDDENTALLAYLANEKLCRTAYLSLTRGEGGQNLIGTERGAALGVIRTQELLAARRIDGAEQMFTRAIDFGFSKTADETLKLWNKQEVLADVVWAIRKFRPDVIITRFPPDERAGHGHHTASAILAEEAFKLSGDKTAFPEQLKFVETWQAKRLVWNAFVRGNDAPPTDAIKVDVGTYNPLLGKSYTEIAAQSRSQHKSQGFGSAERRGSRIEYLAHVAGEKAATDLFDGIDTTWKRAENGEAIQKIVNEANLKFNPQNPTTILPLLIRAYPLMKGDWYKHWWLGIEEQKKQDLSQIILASAGIWIEAVADKPSSFLRGNTKLDFTIVNRSNFPVTLKRIVTLDEKGGVNIGHSLDYDKLIQNNQIFTDSLKIQRDSYEISQPYWLAEDFKGLYLAKVGFINRVGLPENPLDFFTTFRLEFQNQTLGFRTPVFYRSVDRVNGETAESVLTKPLVTANFDNDLIVFPNTNKKTVAVTIRNNAEELTGKLLLKMPQGWTAKPNEIPFSFTKQNQEIRQEIEIEPQIAVKNSEVLLDSEFSITSKNYLLHSSFKDTPPSPSILTVKNQIEIAYPHIPRQILFPNAETKLILLDIKTGKERIGYIQGSGDEIPESLRQIGYDVKLISDADFDTTDFTKDFDVIIAGIRAYNTRQVLRRKNQKLLDFVNNGGKMIIQYNTNDQTLQPDFAPYKLKIGGNTKTRDRVTDENSPVKFLDPNAKLLNFPNKITVQDFANWTQERGTYFASEWDAQFTPVLAMNDPNEPEQNGSLLVAKSGKGEFIYTGIAFFRQLPAGNPGAFRLFANLISK